MKILHIIYTVSSGGAERFIVDLVNELSNQGHEVYLCVLRDINLGKNGFYKDEITSKVKLINLGIPLGFRLSNISVLYETLCEVKPDIVNSHQNLVNYIFPLTLIFRNIKFFHTIHNDAPSEIGNKCEYWLNKFYFLSNKIKAITISKDTSDSFVRYYKTKKFKEIYYGRKMPLQSNKFQSVKEYMDRLRIDNSNVFIHIARFAPQKNQRMLVNVINRLINDGYPIVILFIGSGFESLEGKELKAIASDKIVFLGEKHNVTDYYLNADAFCLSSIYEGMPLSLIESLACGCIPICTPVGDMVNSIENKITGFLSKTVSEDDYYQAVLTFLKYKDKIRKEKLIEFYKSHFSIENSAKQYVELYEKVMF